MQDAVAFGFDDEARQPLGQMSRLRWKTLPPPCLTALRFFMDIAPSCIAILHRRGFEINHPASCDWI